MTSINSAADASNWTPTSDVPAETSSPIFSAKASAHVSLGALSAVRDSLCVLSAFAWGKESRLSKQKSAQLCDLMNAWN